MMALLMALSLAGAPKQHVRGRSDGTKLVRRLIVCAVSSRNQGLQAKHAQSIIGATLKRREGSGRVVAGLEPGLVVISFNVSCTKFSGFEGVRTNPSARRGKSRRQVLGDSQGRRLVYQESRVSVWTRSMRSPAAFCRISLTQGDGGAL